MGHAFDAATAVTRLDGEAGGGGAAGGVVRYRSEIHDGWDIGGAANGGYVLAIAGRAIADATGRPPLTVTAHYLAPGLPGPAEVIVEPVRAGRRMATVTASLIRTDGGDGGGRGGDGGGRDGDSGGRDGDGGGRDGDSGGRDGDSGGRDGDSGGRDGDSGGRDGDGGGRRGRTEVLRVLATCGSPTDTPAVLVDGAPPVLPDYDDCVAPDAALEGAESAAPPAMGAAMPPPGLIDRLALRLRPGDDGFRFGRPTGRAELAGWFTFADGRRIDELAMLLAVDAFAPPVFNAGVGPGWVPTLELTAHIRAMAAPGPLRCAFRTNYVQGGLLSEDGELWDTADRLVAQSRQLALLPRP